jgi:hypothetical protein
VSCGIEYFPLYLIGFPVAGALGFGLTLLFFWWWDR